MIPTETDQVTVPLEGCLTTNTQGIRNLLQWYQRAASYQDTTVYNCCHGLEWIDANLAALWNALIFKLRKENRVEVRLDETSLANRFSILIRNGFSAAESSDKMPQRSFIRNACFGPDQEDAFQEYIASELMQQQQIKNLSPELKGLLEQNLYELYSNVFKHASTVDPFFVCGQYYPKRQELIVSLVDLGRTFLPGITVCTNGAIITQRDAIEWALQGNSEQGKKGGGHALKCIKKVFGQCGHSLQIVTGNAFWDLSYANTLMGAHRDLIQPMPGTMVSFIFHTGRPS